MSFFQIVSANVFSMALNALFYLWIAVMFLGSIPNRGRIGHFAVMGEILFYIVSEAVIGTVFYKTGLFSTRYNAGEILMNYLEILGFALVLWAIYRENVSLCWLTSVFIDLMGTLAWNLSEMFSPNMIFDLNVLEDRMLYLFYEWIVNPLCMLVVLAVLYKTGAGRLYRQWSEGRKVQAGVAVCLSLYPVLDQALVQIVARSDRVGGYNPVLTLLLIMIIYIVFAYVARDEMRKKRIAEQTLSMQQQKNYIENLENLQKEVRRFRHDFKNMMSGMYLHAKEGDMESIQSFIQEITEDFDEQVGTQIRLMNQLANIHMTEVKGLFLEKLQEMKTENIQCEMEVLRKFERTRLRSTDLCRCLGILIDNAIDEVRGKKDGKIIIMISQQERCTTFRIKNTLYSDVKLSSMGTLGYSTKGTDRGVGLFSYRKILDRYEFAFPLMTVEDGCLIQELKIREV